MTAVDVNSDMKVRRKQKRINKSESDSLYLHTAFYSPTLTKNKSKMPE